MSIENNDCIHCGHGFYAERCSALRLDAQMEMIVNNKCGTLACPFYKPSHFVARIGDRFVPYSDGLCEKIREEMMEWD